MRLYEDYDALKAAVVKQERLLLNECYVTGCHEPLAQYFTLPGGAVGLCKKHYREHVLARKKAQREQAGLPIASQQKRA